MTGVLTELAKKHGSDKWGEHSYTPHYERWLSPYRDRPITIFEIGVGGYKDPHAGGASLRMWCDFFPLAKVVSLDFFDKSPHATDRVKIYQGHQQDAELLSRINAESGPFDIVIDDGSHRNAHVIASFETLFPLMKSDGLYVVEDIQTSYWDRYDGSSTELNSKYTTMGYFKALVDGVNHAELVLDEYIPSYFDKNIVGIHFYHNLIFVEKGDNRESSNIVVNNKLAQNFIVGGRGPKAG